MRPSYRLDTICIERIQKYIAAINEAYTMFNIKNAKDLAQSDVCRLAVTQAVTNIHEVKKMIRPDTLKKIPLLAELELWLKKTRNIASHDYDALDFNRFYERTKTLLKRELSDELEAVLNDFNQIKESDLQSP